MSNPTISAESTTTSHPKRPLVPGASFAGVLEDLAKKDKATNAHTRPALPEIQGKPSITFQNIEVCESKHSTNPSEIHLFGVTKAGHSILARVVGFEHYFFYPAPVEIREADMDPLRDYLNEHLRSSTATSEPTSLPISKIEIEELKTTAAGNDLPFLKIHLSNHHEISTAQALFFASGNCQYRDLFSSPELTCEARVPYFLRFMVDTSINPMQWLKIPANKYDKFLTEERISHCQLEVSVHVDDLMTCEVVENREKIAPLRILSYDIETDVPGDNKFPDASSESVIQIGAMLTNYGESVPFLRKIFTLGSCDPITGAQVESFEGEADLLTAWQSFLIESDPDIVTGYNLTQFDIPYLWNRARALKLDGFACLGRLKGSPQVLNPGPPNHLTCPGYEGRLLLDIFHHIREYWPGPQGQGMYKLNSVSERFLGEKKEDIPYTQIPILQRGDSDSRRKLAVYCLKDVYLPLLLMTKLQCFENEVKAAKQAYLPFNVMRNRRGLSTTAKRCRDAISGQYILPDLPVPVRARSTQAVPLSQ